MQVIPDEVVEVAAKASFALAYNVRDWDAINVHIRLQYIEEARAALEAAAPFIAAAGFERGYVAAMEAGTK